MTYLLEATRLGIVDENYARVHLEQDVSQMLNGVIDKLRGEWVADIDSGKTTGISFGGAKQIDNVRFEIGVLSQNRSQAQRLINNGIYRAPGRAAYGTVDYQFKKNKKWRLQQRCRVCIDKSTCDDQYRCDFTLNRSF